MNRFRDIHCCVEIAEMLWSTTNTLLWVMLSVRKGMQQLVSREQCVSSVTWTDNGTIKAVARCTQLGTVEVGTCIWFMMEAKDYTFAEMADIHFFCGCANGNAHEARRLYQETFPNRRLPCSRTFWRIAQRLRERGEIHSHIHSNILCNTQRIPAHERKWISRNLFTFGPMLIRTFLLN